MRKQNLIKMATTSLRVKKNAQVYNLQFFTIPMEDGLMIDLGIYDDDWKLVKNLGKTFESKTEEDYHKELRFESDKKGELEKSMCTNPEWNPNRFNTIEDATI